QETVRCLRGEAIVAYVLLEDLKGNTNVANTIFAELLSLQGYKDVLNFVKRVQDLIQGSKLCDEEIEAAIRRLGEILENIYVANDLKQAKALLEEVGIKLEKPEAITIVAEGEGFILNVGEQEPINLRAPPTIAQLFLILALKLVSPEQTLQGFIELYNQSAFKDAPNQEELKTIYEYAIQIKTRLDSYKRINPKVKNMFLSTFLNWIINNEIQKITLLLEMLKEANLGSVEPENTIEEAIVHICKAFSGNKTTFPPAIQLLKEIGKIQFIVDLLDWLGTTSIFLPPYLDFQEEVIEQVTRVLEELIPLELQRRFEGRLQLLRESSVLKALGNLEEGEVSEEALKIEKIKLPRPLRISSGLITVLDAVHKEKVEGVKKSPQPSRQIQRATKVDLGMPKLSIAGKDLELNDTTFYIIPGPTGNITGISTHHHFAYLMAIIAYQRGIIRKGGEICIADEHRDNGTYFLTRYPEGISLDKALSVHIEKITEPDGEKRDEKGMLEYEWIAPLIKESLAGFTIQVTGDSEEKPSVELFTIVPHWRAPRNTAVDDSLLYSIPFSHPLIQSLAPEIMSVDLDVFGENLEKVEVMLPYILNLLRKSKARMLHSSPRYVKTQSEAARLIERITGSLITIDNLELYFEKAPAVAISKMRQILADTNTDPALRFVIHQMLDEKKAVLEVLLQDSDFHPEIDRTKVERLYELIDSLTKPPVPPAAPRDQVTPIEQYYDRVARDGDYDLDENYNMKRAAESVFGQAIPMDCVVGSKVLNLTTGRGLLAKKATEKGAREVVGVDISSEMLKRAEKTLQPFSSSVAIRLIKGDILNLRDLFTKDGQLEEFNIITLANVLTYYSYEDRKKILSQVLELLEDNGYVAILYRSYDEETDAYHYPCSLKPEQYVELLKEAGFAEAGYYVASSETD
ncbi:MAG: methyltransferase domain-containing protein, partial [Candidatus Omnitrophica bacterium]|nr:methyltransferase domain-containing protein [Candidatus Omnitrophota bacterium]